MTKNNFIRKVILTKEHNLVNTGRLSAMFEDRCSCGWVGEDFFDHWEDVIKELLQK